MHATAIKFGDYLTREQVRRLRRKSDLMGALLVLDGWALIAGSMALFVWWPNPFTFLIGVMVIGGRQRGLAVLMHDAAHGRRPTGGGGEQIRYALGPVDLGVARRLGNLWRREKAQHPHDLRRSPGPPLPGALSGQFPS